MTQIKTRHARQQRGRLRLERGAQACQRRVHGTAIKAHAGVAVLRNLRLAPPGTAPCTALLWRAQHAGRHVRGRRCVALPCCERRG